MSQRPESPPNFGRISAARAEFAAWLDRICAGCIGAPAAGHRPRYLDDKAFLKVMLVCMKRRGETGVGAPDERTLQNWRRGISVPRETFIEPLLDTILPDGPPAERQRGRELWQAAENEKNQSSTNKRRSAGSATPEPQADAQPGDSDWKAENNEPLQRGLAELLVHPPPRGGNAPLEFPLRISLSFAEYADDVEDATLALTEATLIPTYQNCRPAPGTRLGEGATAADPIQFRGGVWRVHGPRTGPHLDGEPIVEEPLCTIQCDGEPGDALSLTLRSGHRALVVIPNEPDTDANPVKQRILQALLQKCLPRDQEGVVTWGRATLRRKPPK